MHPQDNNPYARRGGYQQGARSTHGAGAPIVEEPDDDEVPQASSSGPQRHHYQQQEPRHSYGAPYPQPQHQQHQHQQQHFRGIPQPPPMPHMAHPFGDMFSMMDNMMSSMMGGGLFGGGGLLAGPGLLGAPGGLLGGGLLSDMMAGHPAAGAAGGPGTVYSYSSSSFMSSGPGGTYTSTSTTRQLPGGVRESQHSVRDGRTGQESMTIARALGDKEKVVTRSRDASGSMTTQQELRGLSEPEAARFDDTWREAAGSVGRLPGSSSGGAGAGRHQPPLALPGTSYTQQQQQRQPPGSGSQGAQQVRWHPDDPLYGRYV